MELTLRKQLWQFLFQMSYELYGVLSGAVSLITGEKVRPAYGGDDESFLNNVVKPIYNVIFQVRISFFSIFNPYSFNVCSYNWLPFSIYLMKESQKNKNGASDHSTWRNYDDLNEFFWLDTMLLIV